MHRIDGGEYRVWLAGRGVSPNHLAAHEHALRLFEDSGGCTRSAMSLMIRREAAAGREASRVRNLQAAASYVLAFREEKGKQAASTQGEEGRAGLSLNDGRPDMAVLGVARDTGADNSHASGNAVSSHADSSSTREYRIGDVCGCAAPPDYFFEEVPFTLVGTVGSSLGIMAYIFLGFWLCMLIESAVFLLVAVLGLYLSRWKCLECREWIAGKDLNGEKADQLRNTRIKFAGCVVLAAFLVVFTYRGWAAPIESVILDDILDEKEALDQKWRDEMHKQLDEAAWQPGDPEDGDYDHEDEE